MQLHELQQARWNHVSGARQLCTLVVILAFASAMSACGDKSEKTLAATEPQGLQKDPVQSGKSAVQAYVSGTTWETPEADRTIMCHKTGSPDVQISVRITRATRTAQLPAESGLRQWHLAAKIKNLTNETCHDFKLAGQDSIYWFMGPPQSSGDTFGTTFWTIRADGTSNPASKMMHSYWTKDTTIAPGSARALIGENLPHSLARPNNPNAQELLLFTHNDTWIECLGGCCTGNNLISF